MDGSYLNYSSLMSSAIQDATQKASLEKEAFEGKLAKVGAEKSEVDSLTSLAVMPFEAKVAKVGIQGLSRGIDKISGGKVTELNEFINKKIGRVKTNAEKQLGKLKDKFKSKKEQEEEPDEETSEAPSGESGEVTEPQPVETSADVPEIPEELPEPSMTSAFETGRPILEDMTPNESLMTKLEAGGEQQAQTQAEADLLPDFEGLRDSMAPMRDEMMGKSSDAVNATEADAADATTEGNASASAAGDAANAVNSGDGAAADSGAGGAAAGDSAAADALAATAADTAAADAAAAAAAAADAASAGVGGALMDNPFTFFIGLAMMIGGVVGGVEGSRSIKNPTPKAVAVPNVSTQFGL
tara:strand:+ start:1126 stop:2193 length:1068 start_codon:yes stop_codon:yes gene_type:complete